MIYSRTMFNLSRNIDRFMRVESMVSSGRRINTPSDDPVGTHHDLSYRGRLSQITQYLSNISQAGGWFSAYESGLGDLKDLYSSAKEISIMMANDTYDEVARQAAANEVESIFQQVLQIANNNVDGRYMYSGHMTRTKPLESAANGVVYNGDRGIIDLEIDTASRVRSNLIAEEIFFKQLLVLGESSDLKAGLTGATLVADLNQGGGIDQSPGTFEIYDRNRNVTYTIDLSAAVTVDDVVNAVNAQLGAVANLSLGIADAGASLQWSPTTGTTNTITIDTPLANLNAGRGVDLAGGTFHIRNADAGIAFDVDISSANNLGDVITAINNAMTANGVTGVTAGLNAAGTGLAITDGNAVPVGLIIEETSPSQTTAADLGIVGAINPLLVGTDISPQPDFEIRDIGAQTTAADLGLGGRVTFTTIGESIQPRIMLTTTLASLNNNVGFNLGRLKISQGDQSATLDLGGPGLVTVGDLLGTINACGLEIEASINASGTGIQIVPTRTDKTLIIESADADRTAEILGIAGSPDMLGTLMLLVTALRNDDRDLAEKLNGNLGRSIDELLSTRADVGSTMIRMNTTQNRLEATKISVTKLLSEVEDADMVEMVSNLAKEENLYQAALLASSKMIQKSLVDFLQ
jgi:flagellar hook-associated protein 3